MDISHHKAELRETGVTILPAILTREEAANAKAHLWEAARESERRGASLHLGIDQNASNVRVFGLLELDQLFRELIVHPTGLALVEELLGDYYLVSNFTANIALPGSKSMKSHSDQGIVIPEPWLAPWAINIIWCLDDVYAENGATKYLPGSHKITRASELPANYDDLMVPFEAKAGSIIAMDGRVWHTSGANVTKDKERAMMFAYYSSAFIRPQMNWNAALSMETIMGLSDQLKQMLGVEEMANVGLAARLNFAGGEAPRI